MADRGAAAAMAVFELRQTVWSQLAKWLKPSEVEVARMAIGTDAVQRNQELATEAESLFRVWADFRESSEARLREAAVSSSAQQRLPEPPAQRERLVAQIRLHLANFAEAELRLPVETPRDEAVLRYVTKKAKTPCHVRPMSAPIADKAGRSTVALVDTRQCESCRGAGSAVAASMPPVTLSKPDPRLLSGEDGGVFVEGVRRALEEECKGLLADIEFLRQCIEQETAYHRHAVKAATRTVSDEPALAEIREWNMRLEKVWLESAAARK
jgi:hypothetical protein